MVFSIESLFQQLPLTTLVPSWFYIFSGIIYLLVGIIGFAISYFSFKLYRTTSSKSHLTLSLAFLLIGIAFTSLFGASIFTYSNSESLTPSIFDTSSDVVDAYYLFSLIAYVLLVMVNLPKKEKLYPAFIPLWFTDSLEFHATSLLLILYVAARSVLNFFKVKTQDAFLVMLSFLMISLFHVFLLLIPFGIELYLVAHSFLIIGFLSLLFMLIRVTRK
jgi:hypothetical protein